MTQIIACIDGSPTTHAVTDAAAWVSQTIHAPLVLLHVLDRSAYPVQTDMSGHLTLGSREDLLDELAELDAQRSRLALLAGKEELNAAATRVENAGVPRPETRQRHGHFVETLAELEPDIRLLVMGRQGEDHQAEQDIGSHLESAIRRLSCRILITPTTFSPPKSVMLAYDASPTAHKVLTIVAQSPLFKNIPLHVVMVGESNDTNHEKLDSARQILEDKGHKQVTVAITPGEVEAALLSYITTHGLDMIVMGAYGHSRIRQFLVGSTTSNLLRQSPVPILLMRQ